MSLKEFLKELLALPAKGLTRAKVMALGAAAKVKDAFAWKGDSGKTVVKIGSQFMSSGKGGTMEINSLRTNRWTRFWRLVKFPFAYVWHGEAEL